MNSLVIYDSQFGNTEKIAQRIAETLAEFGSARAERVAEFSLETFRDIELLVIGCPTQAWHSTQRIQTFLRELERHPELALFFAEFDTRLDKPQWLTGSAAKGMAKELRRVGANLLPPESFLVTGTEGPLVEGELERAAEWARALHAEFRAQTERVAVPA